MRVTFACKRCGREIVAEFTRPGKTAQCPGCRSTQEIPGDAPPTQYTAGRPPEGSGKGGGGGSGKLLVIVIGLIALAAAAWFFGKGRFF